MSGRVRRLVVILLIALLAAPGTWLRSSLPYKGTVLAPRFVPVALRDGVDPSRSLGAFRLAGAWKIVARHEWFGGFSAIGALGDGTLLAVSDRGFAFRFSPPGNPPVKPLLWPIMRDPTPNKRENDAEAITIEPATGTFWTAWEDTNSITRHATGLTQDGLAYPRGMAGWGANSGPETLLRLHDGRFITVREGADGIIDDTRHRALLFAGDPIDSPGTREFTFVGPQGFSPVDAAQLPDGRVLLLMRKLVWPMPLHYAGRIVLLDPEAIRPGGDWSGPVVARLSSNLPVDNFEGIGIEPGAGGKVVVWLIADDNLAVTQSSMLWKLELDPRDLPRLPAREKARGAKPRAP